MKHLFANRRHRPTRFARACALCSVALVLVLAVLAASPEAHEWLHHDAGHEDHECAITLFVHGITAVLLDFALVLVIWRLVGVTSLELLEVRFVSAARRLPPSQAPPQD